MHGIGTSVSTTKFLDTGNLLGFCVAARGSDAFKVHKSEPNKPSGVEWVTASLKEPGLKEERDSR